MPSEEFVSSLGYTRLSLKTKQTLKLPSDPGVVFLVHMKGLEPNVWTIPADRAYSQGPREGLVEVCQLVNQ